MKCLLQCLAFRTGLLSSWFSWIGLALSGNFTKMLSKGPPDYSPVPFSRWSLRWSSPYSDKTRLLNTIHTVQFISASAFSHETAPENFLCPPPYNPVSSREPSLITPARSARVYPHSWCSSAIQLLFHLRIIHLALTCDRSEAVTTELPSNPCVMW